MPLPATDQYTISSNHFFEAFDHIPEGDPAGEETKMVHHTRIQKDRK
jgi:hypothetical protein